VKSIAACNEVAANLMICTAMLKAEHRVGGVKTID
jgi:hypothetical protein